jgi:hypothetical protein
MPDAAVEEAEHEVGDQISLLLESEMAGVQQVDGGFRQLAAECQGSRHR